MGLLAIVVVAFGALALLGSQTKVVADATALAHIETPVTGGTIERVSATGPGGRPISVSEREGRLWPTHALAPGEPISIEVVARRPGWIGWLAGSTDSERLSLRTPSAHVLEHYVTLAARAPLKVSFDQPVSKVVYGEGEHVQSRALVEPHSQVTLAHDGEAGSIEVAAVPRTWERLPRRSVVSWFPAGAQASAVVTPSPGTRIAPTTPIYVTFSQPVSHVLGGDLPRVQPSAEGTWHGVDSHTLVFRPHGYGYGLDTPVTLGLPQSVRLVGGQNTGSSSVATWTVPPGSTLRLQQILAQLGYLPLDFNPEHPLPTTAAAQEAAAIAPPAGSFAWRYYNIPASLREMWQQGSGEHSHEAGR